MGNIQPRRRKNGPNIFKRNGFGYRPSKRFNSFLCSLKEPYSSIISTFTLSRGCQKSDKAKKRPCFIHKKIKKSEKSHNGGQCCANWELSTCLTFILRSFSHKCFFHLFRSGRGLIRNSSQQSF